MTRQRNLRKRKRRRKVSQILDEENLALLTTVILFSSKI